MTNTTTPQSARVDVLTAEVRVLQVGSRQVTLSVYRQLDRQNNTDRLEAFGRVRDGHQDDDRYIQVVGRDTGTGALVRHTCRPPDWSAWEGPDEFEHWLIHKKPAKSTSGAWTVAESDGRSIRWTGVPRGPRMREVCSGYYRFHVDDAEAPSYVREHVADGRGKLCTVDLGQLERGWRAEAEEYLAELLKDQAEYDQFKALPLIVLAGLK